MIRTGPTGGGMGGRQAATGEFDGYMAERARLQAMGEGREYMPTPEALQALAVQTVNTGPVSHKGFGPIDKEIDNFKAALARTHVVEAFLPSVGPDNMGYQPGQVEYYGSQEDYLRACARAIREEYRAILDAGFVLQIDTPVAKFNALGMAIADFRKRFGLLVDVFNETLDGLDTDRIRLHICYGGGRGPHSEDVTLPGVHRPGAPGQSGRSVIRPEPTPRVGMGDVEGGRTAAGQGVDPRLRGPHQRRHRAP